MNTDIARNQTRLNQYCKLMSVLILIPILCMLIGTISPLLYYFFDKNNIGFGSDGYSFFISTTMDDSIDISTGLNFWQAALATLIDTGRIVILIYAFNQLRLMLVNFAQADYFSVKSTKYCYNFGKFLVIWAIMGILSEPVITAILSYNQPERYFTVSFTSEDFMTLLLAISIMLIGQILKKASQIAEENRQFI
ncbi:DUF2975 domain-containing protein [Gilliamella sp. B3023]|uniref:DUF2975 domain-containing protein n=1 Tax=unclassified Gilliamella TaxID=2685620 RepID=UPI00226ACD5F|nr:MULTISPECIES: DUF2975 domain-containing protein [unclassified Gilliamella]MCX8586761.1 DUF2975 domain-containing protein [Gilliamella sp. B3562]MCX8675700.1 DUF2975 domain-containing protein [Gilliamella sp. B3023]MCX8686449.1 DUF2975 domain-containing protein [Gilliamella sp. B2864]